MSVKEKKLYCPLLITLPLASYAVNMNYLEILDETFIDTNHVHDFFELCFCLEHKLTMKASNRDHILHPGDFLLIMPGTMHNVIYEPDEKKKYFIMIFNVPHVDENDEEKRPLMTRLNQLSLSKLVARGNHQVDEITAVIAKMEREWHDKSTGWFFLFRGYCLEFLFYCLREVIEPVIEYPKEEKHLNLAIAITKYMHNNYSEKITLRDIVNHLNTSPRHAQRIFSDYFGVSCAKTLNLYRMNYAKNYLTGTDLSINEIAQRVGLASPQAMNGLFLEHEKMTVNEYRKTHKALVQEKLDT